MIAEIIVDISNSEVDRVFDYAVGDCSVQPGYRVLVPFGNRNIEGYIISLKGETEVPEGKLKAIASVLDGYPIITKEMMSLMQYMIKQYHLRIIDALRLFIPSKLRGGRVRELTRQTVRINESLCEEDAVALIKPSAKAQTEAYHYLKENGETLLSELNKHCSAAAVRNLTMRGIFAVRDVQIQRVPYQKLPIKEDKQILLTKDQLRCVEEIRRLDSQIFLLHGVTGSGKTEVYLNSIMQVLSEGKQALMLVPEISLTPQVLQVFRARLGKEVALMHSGLSDGERFDEWKRLLLGEAKVAVGARSAIFAPLDDLGLIIIDEEHDSSYISDSNPRYNTQEIAAFRMRFHRCNLVLGSATPSIESYYYARCGLYKLLELPHRINQKALPEITVVDMCKEVYAGNNGLFSNKLQSELIECVEQGNQAIVFINRRGYASYVMCRSCGYVAKCTDCDVSLVYHKEENVLKCHYCNNRYAMLDICPVCKSAHIKRGFVGTEQVMETLQNMFPSAGILRMDNDTTQGKDAHQKILAQFAQRKANLLVGTQMIAKGHDFPDVTLVGIVDADMSLYFADYRSNERTYQLITQVSGRAGRDSKPGKVVLQTYTPNHYVFRYAVKNDYLGFFEKENNLREVTKYPPFSKIIRILISSDQEQLALEVLRKIFQDIKALADAQPEAFAFLAAMKSPVKRIKSKFRLQILLRITQNYDTIIEAVYAVTDRYIVPKITCFVEINPNNLS